MQLCAFSYSHFLQNIWLMTTKASTENNMSPLRPLNSQNPNLLLYLSPFCFPFCCLHYPRLTASSSCSSVKVGVWFSSGLNVSWVYFHCRDTYCHNNTDSIRFLWMLSCSSWHQPLVSGCTVRWCSFFFSTFTPSKYFRNSVYFLLYCCKYLWRKKVDWKLCLFEELFL